MRWTLPLLAVALLGCQANRMKLGDDVYQIEPIAVEDAWAVEGNAQVEIKNGVITIRRGDVNPEQSVSTIWYHRALPQNVLVKFRATVLPPEENNAANVNIFLHARELDGSPVHFDRSGKYDDYHAIPNYIVTLTGGNTPGWSRVRRNPGFQMLSESNIRSKVRETYDVAVTLKGGRLRYYLKGRKIHDVTDPQPLPAGHFALRTWSTDVEFRDLVFAELKTD